MVQISLRHFSNSNSSNRSKICNWGNSLKDNLICRQATILSVYNSYFLHHFLHLLIHNSNHNNNNLTITNLYLQINNNNNNPKTSCFLILMIRRSSKKHNSVMNLQTFSHQTVIPILILVSQHQQLLTFPKIAIIKLLMNNKQHNYNKMNNKISLLLRQM